MELESTESTQDDARGRYEPPRPLLVTARRQTGGRGRLGRSWAAADRAMYASLAFEPAWPTDRWTLIPLVAGLAAREAVEDLSGVTVGLRWPNDLVTGDGGKLGGLLAEASDGLVVVGCGINLAWASPMAGARALDDVAPGETAAGDLARVWVDHLLEAMDAGPDRWGRDAYLSACDTLGRPVAYAAGSGIAVGIGTDGSLLVDTGERIVPVSSGEVRLHDVATLTTNRRD